MTYYSEDQNANQRNNTKSYKVSANNRESINTRIASNLSLAILNVKNAWDDVF